MVTNLRKLREQKGMTQEQLSAASRVHRVSIAKYEAGKAKPSLESAYRLATALGVPVDELIQKAG